MKNFFVAIVHATGYGLLILAATGILSAAGIGMGKALQYFSDLPMGSCMSESKEQAK